MTTSKDRLSCGPGSDTAFVDVERTKRDNICEQVDPRALKPRIPIGIRVI